MQFKEYSCVPNKLSIASRTSFTHYIKCTIQYYVLPTLITKRAPISILLCYFFETVNFDITCECEQSQLFKERFIKEFLLLCSSNWDNGINRILSGKESRINLQNSVYKEAASLAKCRPL